MSLLRFDLVWHGGEKKKTAKKHEKRTLVTRKHMGNTERVGSHGYHGNQPSTKACQPYWKK